MSGIVDTLGDVTATVGRAVKDIFVGLADTVDSLLGHGGMTALMIVAAVYSGGSALGYWGAGEGAAGAAAAGAADATAADAATGATEAGIGEEATAEGVGQAGEAASADLSGTTSSQLSDASGNVGQVADETGNATEAGTSAQADASQAANATENAATPETTAPTDPTTTGLNQTTTTDWSPLQSSVGPNATTGPGLIGGQPGLWDSLGPMGKFAAVQAGAGALKSAFSPSQAETANQIAQQQMERDQEMMRWRQQFLAPNFNVGNIHLGKPTNTPMTDRAGNPVYSTPAVNPGLIQNAMR